MKQQPFVTFLVGIVSTTIMISSCDLGDVGLPPPAPKNNREICVNVLDHLTGAIMDSVYVALDSKKEDQYGTWVEYGYGYTRSGRWCGSYSSGYAPWFLRTYEKGFVDLCMENPRIENNEITVRMKRPAHLQLHVKNATPSHTEDWFIVRAPGTTCFGNQHLDFYGAAVDTIVNIECRPGQGYLIWKLCSVLGNTDDHYIQIFPGSNDMTKMELIY